MEERILVPLDGSEVGEAVLPKLEDLILRATPKMDVEVTLLRVLSKMNFNMLHNNEAAQLPIDPKDLEQMTLEAQQYLDKVAVDLKSKGIRSKTMIVSGNVPNEIVKAARDTKAHLIAMATHGRSGVVRWAIGSVTDKVMRIEGQIPVLTVKANDKEEATVIPIKSLNSLMKHS